MSLMQDPAARGPTYRAIAENNPFPRHDSERALEAFSPTDTTITTASLVALITNGVVSPGPSYFLAWDRSGFCHILHRPMMQKPTVGEAPQAFHNILYLLRGDIHPNGDKPMGVPIPEALFECTQLELVSTLGAWKFADATEGPAVKWLAPVDPADPPLASDKIRTRKCMPIPKELVSLFWGDMTPRVALRSVCRKMDELAAGDATTLAELETTFKLFIEHLRFACTEDGCKQLGIKIDPLWHGPGRAWVSSVVANDLRAVQPVQPGDTTNTELLKKFSAIAQATADNAKTNARTVDKVTELLAKNHQGPLQQPPSKTVEAKWPETKDVLLRVTGVTSTQQLPEVWRTIARAGKHENLRAVETLLGDEARQLHLHYRFVVSARFLKAVTELRFASKENLETGVNIFNSVVLSSQKQQAAAVAEYNDTARMLEAGTVSTLGDRKAHQKFKHAVFPTSEKECRSFVFGYLVVLRVLFGPTHPLTTSYKVLTTTYEQVADRLDTAAGTGGSPYTRFLAGVHARVDAYFEALEPASANAGTAVPTFQPLIDNLLFDGALPVASWLPAPSTPSQVPSPPAQAPGPPSRDPARGSERQLGASAPNPHIDRSLTIAEATSVMIRLVGPPPKHADGTDMCLIYHCKSSGCHENCKRKASHRQLTPAEKVTLTEFVQKYREKKAAN